MSQPGRSPLAFPPSFASAWGDDPYGLWADLQVFSQVEGGSAVQRMRWIEPGNFWMGAPDDEPERGNDESPRHPVTLTRGFWLADTTCTQGFWQALMGSGRSHFRDDPENPVENVSWEQVQQFLEKLGRQLNGLIPRLPSEAEWEYACRAGTDMPFSFGANITTEQVNFNGNHPYAGAPKGLYRKKTVPAKALPPNAWGLYGMHGNVFEWCQDWFGPYSREPATDPTGPDTGDKRVVRGGCFTYMARAARSSYRDCKEPDYHYRHIGFRLAISPSVETRPKPPPPPKPPAPPWFEVIDLGELDVVEQNIECRTSAIALNNKGDVIGHSNGRPFLWCNGQMEDLSVHGFGTVKAINDSKTIIGSRRTEDPYLWQLALVRGGEATETLDSFGEKAWADSINRDGVIAGWVMGPSGNVPQATVWIRGSATSLGLYGKSMGPVVINDAGQVAITTHAGGESEAYCWNGGATRALESKGNLMCFANGINSLGEIVGHTQRTPEFERKAALWNRSGSLVELTAPNGLNECSAHGINDAGQIVGSANIHEKYDTLCAVLWHNRIPYDLNTRIINKPAARLTIAIAINKHGEIIANDSDGRGYLLLPV